MKTLVKSAIRIIILLWGLRYLLLLINNVSNALVDYSSTSFTEIYQGQSLFFVLCAAIIPALIIWGILFLLWWKSDWLVLIISGNSEDNEIKITASNLDVFWVVSQILGLYFVVSSIPILLGLFVNHIKYNSIGVTDSIIIPDWVTPLATMVIGIILLIGLKRIWKYLVVLKESFINPKDEDPEQNQD
jgi:hypothetical protein